MERHTYLIVIPVWCMICLLVANPEMTRKKHNYNRWLFQWTYVSMTYYALARLALDVATHAFKFMNSVTSQLTHTGSKQHLKNISWKTLLSKTLGELYVTQREKRKWCPPIMLLAQLVYSTFGVDVAPLIVFQHSLLGYEMCTTYYLIFPSVAIIAKHTVAWLRQHFVENPSSTSALQCSICYCGTIDACFSPCGHTYCAACADKIFVRQKCAFCNQPIKKIQPLYFT